MKINGIKEANILGLSLANFVPSGKLQNPYSQTCITNILWPKLCMAAYACKAKARDVQGRRSVWVKERDFISENKSHCSNKNRALGTLCIILQVCGGGRVFLVVWPITHISTLLVVLWKMTSFVIFLKNKLRRFFKTQKGKWNHTLSAAVH